jgi:hypothetical protein
LLLIVPTILDQVATYLGIADVSFRFSAYKDVATHLCNANGLLKEVDPATVKEVNLKYTESGLLSFWTDVGDDEEEGVKLIGKGVKFMKALIVSAMLGPQRFPEGMLDDLKALTSYMDTDAADGRDSASALALMVSKIGVVDYSGLLLTFMHAGTYERIKVVVASAFVSRDKLNAIDNHMRVVAKSVELLADKSKSFVEPRAELIFAMSHWLGLINQKEDTENDIKVFEKTEAAAACIGNKIATSAVEITKGALAALGSKKTSSTVSEQLSGEST